MTIYFDEDKNAYAFPISNPATTISDAIWADYAGTEKWDIIDGVFSDITETSDYKTKIAEADKETQTTELTSQIEALDLKRIRALAEGGNYDDNTTWLEYYNQQIISLRTQLSEL